MTDRYRKLTILLDKEYREDDLESIIASLKMLRCVQAVAHAPTSLNGESIAASDYRRSHGHLISDVAMSSGPLGSVHEREFINTVKAAHEKLKQVRGY